MPTVTVDQADYTYGKTRFGDSGTGAGKAVPEPAPCCSPCWGWWASTAGDNEFSQFGLAKD
jgi:hypothetical protein